MEKEKMISFEEFEVGQKFKPHEFTMTKETIYKYAEAVFDNNPLYREEESGKSSFYGSIIAPPTSAAIYIISAFQSEGKIPPGAAVHARQKFKFIRPVFPGDHLVTNVTVKNKFVKMERKYVFFEMITLNQNGEPVVNSEITVFWTQ
ncbi:MAG TPA: hypothetical protein DCW46_05390 [Desulfotomaculum sp.]|nr:hypothetical protein [Desulfotomaculum sp.]